MPEAEILHRLYTNAAEEAGRIVKVDGDAERIVSKEILRALDDLLRKTSPSTAQTGWVVRRFVDGKSTWGCVIASHGDLVSAKGRDGVLNHARMVAIDGPSFDASALIAVADAFPNDDVCRTPAAQRLRAYLDAVSSETTTIVRPVVLGELQDAPLLHDMLLACVATLNQQGIAVKIANANVEDLARAWAALPLALQLRTSWAVGVKDGCPVNVHFSATEGKAPSHFGGDALKDSVREYVRLIHGAPGTVSAMLANPELRDANAFARAVSKSALAPELQAVAGKEEMPRKRTDATWQPLDDDSRSEVNRQLNASADLLRGEMNDRLRTFEEKMRAQSPAQQQRNALLPVWIAVGVLALAVAFLFYRSFTQPPRTRVVDRAAAVVQNQPVDEPLPARESETPSLPPAREAIARAESSNQWAEEFKSLLENDAPSVSNLVDELAQKHDSEPLASFARRIETLTPTQREQLRALLIDALAAESNARVKVDGKLADVDLAGLKKRYRVNSDLSPKDVQSEILLRWIAEREQ